jgi:CheY-like chemotaxis protein
MDVQMPVIDGLEAARCIRSAEAASGAKPARILALTANAYPEDREAARATGMDGFLVKPLHAERLREAIATAPAPALGSLAA